MVALQSRELISGIIDRVGVGGTLVLRLSEFRRLVEIGRNVVELRIAEAHGPNASRNREQSEGHDGTDKNAGRPLPSRHPDIEAGNETPWSATALRTQ